MNVGKLGRTSRITAEYDAYGQVVITEDGGKFSLRSRGSSDAVSTSVYGADEVRSLHNSNGRAPERINDDRLSPTQAVQADWVERPASPQTNGSSSRYRRRADSVDDEAASPGTVAPGSGVGGTMSTTSSSLLRRIGGRAQRRRLDSESSDSDSTTHYSDFSRKQPKRAGGRRRRNRRKKKKKHKGRSIDKHSADRSGLRRYSASDIYDADGPDNEYWRELVAEQRRRSSLERPTRRGRRSSASSSPHRRRHTIDNRLSVQPPRANGTSLPPSVATGSGNGTTHHSARRLLSTSSSKLDERGCCGSVVGPAVGLLFVVVGCLLIIVGVIRIFICFWHEFGSSVWAGALVSYLNSMIC